LVRRTEQRIGVAALDRATDQLFDTEWVLDDPTPRTEAHRHLERAAQASHASLDRVGLEPARELLELVVGPELVTEGHEEPLPHVVEIDTVANRCDVGALRELLCQRLGKGHDRGPLARHHHEKAVEYAGGL